MNVQTKLASQPSLAQTLPRATDALQDLQNVLDAEIHMTTMDTAKKDEKDSRQIN